MDPSNIPDRLSFFRSERMDDVGIALISSYRSFTLLEFEVMSGLFSSVQLKIVSDVIDVQQNAIKKKAIHVKSE